MGIQFGAGGTTGASELEAEGTFVSTDGRGDLDVHYLPLRARLLLNVPAGEHTSLLLGGGYVHNEYRDDLDGSDDGATGMVGTRSALAIQGSPFLKSSSHGGTTDKN